jgi:hypothetical protein
MCFFHVYKILDFFKMSLLHTLKVRYKKEKRLRLCVIFKKYLLKTTKGWQIANLLFVARRGVEPLLQE